MFKRNKSPNPTTLPASPYGAAPVVKKSSRLKRFFSLLASAIPYYLPLFIYFLDYWLKKYLSMPSLSDLADNYVANGLLSANSILTSFPLSFVLWVLMVPFAIAIVIAVIMMAVRYILFVIAQVAFGLMMPSFLTNQQSFVYDILKKILPKKIINPAAPIIDTLLTKIIDKIIFFVKWLVIIIFIAVNGARLMNNIKLNDFLISNQKAEIVNQIENNIVKSTVAAGWGLLNRFMPFLPKKNSTPTTTTLPADENDVQKDNIAPATQLPF